MTCDYIPSVANKSRFTTDEGNSLSSVNELHSEIKDLIRRKRGVSIRHLQGYLDWLVFRKHLKYTLKMKKWRSEAYMETMQEIIPFSCRSICKKDIPINLYEAYGSYNYGIFRFINEMFELSVNYYNNERIQKKTKWMPPVVFRKESIPNNSVI